MTWCYCSIVMELVCYPMGLLLLVIGFVLSSNENCPFSWPNGWFMGMVCYPTGMLVVMLCGFPRRPMRTVVIQGHVDELWGLACHPNQNQLVTCGYDKNVYLWDTLTHTAIWCLQMEVSLRFITADLFWGPSWFCFEILMIIMINILASTSVLS